MLPMICIVVLAFVALALVGAQVWTNERHRRDWQGVLSVNQENLKTALEMFLSQDYADWKRGQENPQAKMFEQMGRQYYQALSARVEPEMEVGT